ncbi:MAG: hypothetical protein Q7U51_07540 [Methanoregula sp.]|nr:hypothetical protein [Methanoregula sp.]
MIIILGLWIYQIEFLNQLKFENILSIGDQLIIGITTGIVATLLLFKYLVKKESDLVFKKTIVKLLSEMTYNFQMQNNFRNHNYISEAQHEWENGRIYWIPEKAPSFTPWSGFIYQYYPANAYYYFTKQDFIIEQRLSRGILAALARFYASCITFSHQTQLIENHVNPNRHNLSNEQISSLCNDLQRIANFHNEVINREYRFFLRNEEIRLLIDDVEIMNSLEEDIRQTIERIIHSA